MEHRCVYDIAKMLGLEQKEVLETARELGIAEARIPSSLLDEGDAERLEKRLRADHPYTVPPTSSSY
jgi:hypothetical protein